MALILLLLIGAVFGFGFKVRVLIPATFLTVILTSSFEIIHERGSLTTALVTTAAVIAIQMGYLIGVVVRVGTDSGLTAVRGLRNNSSATSRAGLEILSIPKGGLEAAMSSGQHTNRRSGPARFQNKFVR